MFDLDTFGEVLQTLRRNALRTVLTAVGVFWGVFLLIVMVGFGNGLETGAKKNMMGSVTNSLFMWGQRTSVPFAGLTPGRRVRLTLDDAKALAQVAGVDVVAPRVSLGGRRSSQSVTRGNKTGTFSVMGDVPEFLRVEPMAVHGRFINHLDMVERRKVAVIGKGVVELLYPGGEEPIGATLKIQGIDFMVVGVFETEATGDRGDRQAATIYTPLTTFQRTLSHDEGIDYISVVSQTGVPAGSIEEELANVIRKRHRIAPKDKQAIGSWNMDVEFQKIASLFQGITLLIYLVGGATLMAGLVGVSNIMMVSVRERTREIGIRKAIGATPFTVVSQIVLEAVALASVAGYMGLVVGVGLLEVVGRYIEQNPSDKSMFAAPEITLATAAVAAVAVAVGGGLAGLFPALHAARIQTVIALRDD